jgi:hypothetical protein
MHTITARFTDENGKERAGQFWVEDRDVEYERTRFESAGYTVEFQELHWIMATRVDPNGERSAQAQWITHENLEGVIKGLHESYFDILIFEKPGKLQRHILAPPRPKGES